MTVDPKRMSELGRKGGAATLARFGSAGLAAFRRGKFSHRLYLTLRRPNPGEGFRWTAVRGIRVKLKDPVWAKLKLFAYRDGPVVFISEEETGLTMSVGQTLPSARTRLLRFLRTWDMTRLTGHLTSLSKHVDAGPKPTVKLKTAS